MLLGQRESGLGIVRDKALKTRSLRYRPGSAPKCKSSSIISVSRRRRSSCVRSSVGEGACEWGGSTDMLLARAARLRGCKAGCPRRGGFAAGRAADRGGNLPLPPLPGRRRLAPAARPASTPDARQARGEQCPCRPRLQWVSSPNRCVRLREIDSPKAGAAILAVGGAVGPTERFEIKLLLFLARRCRCRESQNRGGASHHRLCASPPDLWAELDGVGQEVAR